MGTLFEAIDIALETHLRFKFPNESPVGDNLRSYLVPLKFSLCHIKYLDIYKLKNN